MVARTLAVELVDDLSIETFSCRSLKSDGLTSEQEDWMNCRCRFS